MEQSPDPNQKIKSYDKGKSTFLKDTLKLMGGTTISAIILIISSPILTRLYGPEAFGVFTIFVSITGTLSVIACMRYEIAIILPDSDEDAANLLGLSIFWAIITSIILIPFIWFFRISIVNILKTPEILNYFWLIPIFTLILGIFSALTYWNTRTKNFGRISVARVANSFAATSIQIGAGLAGFTFGGTLIDANIVGQFVSTIVLGFQILRDDFKLFIKSIRWPRMIQVCKRYSNFPLYSSLSTFLNTLSWQFPVLMLGFYFSPVVAGYYGLAYRVLLFPMTYLGSAIAQVFFQRAAEARQTGNLSSLVEDVFHILVVISLFPILLLLCMGPDFFSIIFGSRWHEAGFYAQILSLWAFIIFLSSPLDQVFLITEKQPMDLKFNIANIITRFGSLAIGGLYNSPTLALVLFAISGVLVYG